MSQSDDNAESVERPEEGHQVDPMSTSGAIIDEDYRYCLWRIWQRAEARVLFIMLNPSTADQTQDDATIRRCISFGRSWGAGSIEVVNLYAFRTRNPAMLTQASCAVGPENNVHIRAAAERAAIIVCAWGAYKHASEREREVLALLESRDLYCLGYTRGGHPRHPLYVPTSALLQRYQVLADSAEQERRADLHRFA